MGLCWEIMGLSIVLTPCMFNETKKNWDCEKFMNSILIWKEIIYERRVMGATSTSK